MSLTGSSHLSEDYNAIWRVYSLVPAIISIRASFLRTVPWFDGSNSYRYWIMEVWSGDIKLDVEGQSNLQGEF